jgi:hypothetical protein
MVYVLHCSKYQHIYVILQWKSTITNSDKSKKNPVWNTNQKIRQRRTPGHDVLSINNHNFHNYVHLIYPNELKIKDTTESDKSASYLDILLNIDSNGRLTTSLYDKSDDFDFAIVNFPFLCSNIPLSPAYGVYIYQLIRYARTCFAYEDFSKRANYLQKSWCCRVIIHLI